jgi:hypothetical protein
MSQQRSEDREELRAKLSTARLPITPATYDPRELEGLPSPVQRYVRAVSTDGEPMVAAARVTHEGRFNLGLSAEQPSGEEWRGRPTARALWRCVT